MKKVIALSLVLLMLAACGNTAAPVVTKTGLGISNSIGSSKNANVAEETDGLAQADITTAALTLDESGKILSISVNAIQPKVYFDAEGNLVTDSSTTFKTKKDLGEDYGMRKASPIGAEWFEQAAAFEAWATGRQVSDVYNMETAVRDENHTRVPTDPDLLVGCTIDVGAILDAVKDAADKAK